LAVALAINQAGVQVAHGFQPHGHLGTVFLDFNDNIDNYQHADILRFVVFYNENFGIIHADPLPDRKHKLRRWFTEDVA
jgi:hypothetical protein